MIKFYPILSKTFPVVTVWYGNGTLSQMAAGKHILLLWGLKRCRSLEKKLGTARYAHLPLAETNDKDEEDDEQQPSKGDDEDREVGCDVGDQ